MKPTDKLKLEAQRENFAEKKVNKISPNLPVSGSLPNWWDLQIEQLKELEKVIEKRIKELEGNPLTEKNG